MLPSHQLLRLESLFVSTAAWRLTTLALTNGVFLGLFEFAAVHVLGCVGCPEHKGLSVVKEDTRKETAKKRKNDGYKRRRKIPTAICLGLSSDVGCLCLHL